MTLTDNELIKILTVQLPRLLKERPEVSAQLHSILRQYYIDRDEWNLFRLETDEFRTEIRASLKQINCRLDGLDEFREETRENFKEVNHRLDRLEDFRTETERNFQEVYRRITRVEERLDNVEERLTGVEGELKRLRTEMETGFKRLERQIDRLGQRWGIRNESLFRQTIKVVLGEIFGANVETRKIGREDEQFDIVISNGKHILIEIAASVKRNIVERLQRKHDLYTEETGTAPDRVILVVGSIHRRRAQMIEEAGFEVIEPDEEDEIDL